MADIKKPYEELRKKHKLPKFEGLEEFQISEIEDAKFLLSEIRVKIVEKLQDSQEFLSDILNPDTNLTNMYESKVFDNEEKKEVFDIFKRLMFWKRASLAASINNDDHANAQFIKDFTSEWPSLKPKLVEMVDRVKDSWETELEQTEKLGYFG